MASTSDNSDLEDGEIEDGEILESESDGEVNEKETDEDKVAQDSLKRARSPAEESEKNGLSPPSKKTKHSYNYSDQVRYQHIWLSLLLRNRDLCGFSFIQQVLLLDFVPCSDQCARRTSIDMNMTFHDDTHAWWNRT